ncbi:MAG TPA: MoaD/ThiS family protein [Jatrophihabitans sp.]|nr:MoaD/ThiS family protein [Jatrophihabitans sp.]
MARVVLPGALRQFADGRQAVELDHADPAPLAAVLDALAGQCPALDFRLRDEQGRLRRYVNIYLDGEDVRRLAVLDTPVPAGAEIRILPSVAGG